MAPTVAYASCPLFLMNIYIEIQEFLVKIKMLFLRSLEVFISLQEINLCRLDTFPIMVANKSSIVKPGTGF